MTPQTERVLHLADNALVLGQRNSQWCAHAPALEEDMAMANISLDLIGQARLLYQHAAGLLRGGATEDSLAYWRDASEFRNFTLLELPHHGPLAPGAEAPRDWATTIVRNFLYSAFATLHWELLACDGDAQLAAIAAKSIKETRYHLRHAGDWLVRLGDGTAESHARAQAALDHLMPYTQEFWLEVAPEVAALRAPWQALVAEVVGQATLRLPDTAGHVSRGKLGQHSEHLSHLLADMQSLARAHPGAVW